MTEDEVLAAAEELCRAHGAKEVILYGSRAKGTAGPGSDIDLAVRGVKDFGSLREETERLAAPCGIDLVDLDDPEGARFFADLNRFPAFCRSLALLCRAEEEDLDDPFMLSGVGAVFVRTFDLAWKVMKDLLRECLGRNDFRADSPAEVLAAAASCGLIGPEEWDEMLRARNALAEEQDMSLIPAVINRYPGYLSAFRGAADVVLQKKGEET